MTPSRSGRSDDPSPVDPWGALGYLVAGAAFYGAIGYGLSVWLHAPFLIPIGIVVGVGFGMYMVFARTRYRESPPASDNAPIDAGQAPDDQRLDRGDDQ